MDALVATTTTKAKTTRASERRIGVLRAIEEDEDPH
jgi:hypothetical protein